MLYRLWPQNNYLVNLFLTNLVRISVFLLIFPAIAAFVQQIAGKREENPEIVTKLVRKRLTRYLGNSAGADCISLERTQDHCLTPTTL